MHRSACQSVSQLLELIRLRNRGSQEETESILRSPLLPAGLRAALKLGLSWPRTAAEGQRASSPLITDPKYSARRRSQAPGAEGRWGQEGSRLWVRVSDAVAQALSSSLPTSPLRKVWQENGNRLRKRSGRTGETWIWARGWSVRKAGGDGSGRLGLAA